MRIIAFVLTVLAAVTPADAQTIYPVDRADILTGARFDLKVEFEGLRRAADIRVTINGQSLEAVFGRAAQFAERDGEHDASAILLRDVSLTVPGVYRLEASDGARTAHAEWTVYATGPRRAKNVILFIGDGLSLAHRVSARLMSKGIAEGKARGRLAMDALPRVALVATAGLESIITDSANSASAYATGHKTATGALGVYPDRTADPLDDPRVENIASLARKRGLAIGLVTTTAIADATPAAMLAHTRRRSEQDRIVEHYLAAKPEVLLGGGRAHFLPRSTPGSRRKDETDVRAAFRDAGYAYAETRDELLAVPDGTRRLLGLFHASHMDGALDRRFLKGGSVGRYPNQPDLTDQVRVALDVLARNESGFFLMVESGLIDHFTHALDMERAVYDTIMLDNAVGVARDWARLRGEETLMLVISDHTHPVSLVGTIDDDMSTTPATPLRERVRVYGQAGFPNYPPPDAEGYPPRVDVSRRLALFSASIPDHFETFRPKLDAPNQPTMPGPARTYTANDRYRNAPGAALRLGNLPTLVGASVHSGEDVILSADGPGSERVGGMMDNTEVFRVMAEALGLGHRP